MQEEQTQHILPLPLTIGGSYIGGERLTGPPNKTFPVLRDLTEDSKYTVVAEFDTLGGRFRGRVGKPSSGGSFWYYPPVEKRSDGWAHGVPDNAEEWRFHTQAKALKYSEVIAFRVLYVKGELPSTTN